MISTMNAFGVEKGNMNGVLKCHRSQILASCVAARKRNVI